jgi:hypothetical protein
MSALLPKADICRRQLNVCFGPGADLNCGAAKKAPDYSITSSAVATSVFGTYRAHAGVRLGLHLGTIDNQLHHWTRNLLDFSDYRHQLIDFSRSSAAIALSARL